MSHELYYTSAPQGLKPGSHGFCTVAMTRGLPAALAERLEAMSAYRPAYPPQDSRAPLNPVVRAHCRVTVGGRAVDVLSRLSAAGLDYTQRHNKFAHHVVLEPDELPAGGPAWLLQQPAFMATEWDGEVHVLPAGRRPPQGEAPAGVCKHWERLTGDAGWAGVLAGSFLNDASRPAYLLFDPGFDPLPLLAEAVGLVPAERRWEVTFSTYYTGLPQGVRCAWRCILHDSPEAAEADRLPGALVLNLGTALGRSPDGDLARQARTGQVAATGRGVAPAPRRAAPAAPPPRRPNVAVGRAREIPMPDPEDDDSFDGAPAPPPPPVRQAVPPPPPVPPRPPREAARPRGSLLMGLVIGLAIALPLGGVGIAAVLLTRGEPAAPTAADPVVGPKTEGERFFDGVGKVELKAMGAKESDKKGEECADDLARLMETYKFRNISALLDRQAKARKDLEEQRRKSDENAGKKDERLANGERRVKLAQRVVDLHRLLLELATAEKPLDRKAVQRIGDGLDEVAGKLKEEDANLVTMEDKVNNLTRDLDLFKAQNKPGPADGGGNGKEPEELTKAKEKIKEYHHLMSDGKKIIAETVRGEAIELLNKVINAGPDRKIDAKYVETAKTELDKLKKR